MASVTKPDSVWPTRAKSYIFACIIQSDPSIPVALELFNATSIVPVLTKWGDSGRTEGGMLQ